MINNSDYCEDTELRENIRVGIFVISPKKVLLIKRFKKGRHYWVFPGGHKRQNEKPIETALRELKEETNINASAKDLKKTLQYKNRNTQNEEVFYLLKIASTCPVKIIGEEAVRNCPKNSYHLIWFSKNKIKEIKSTLYSEKARNWLLDFIKSSS